MKFNMDDGWMLLSVFHYTYNQKGSTLRSIIATADYLNHATPLYAEIADAMKKLSMIGFVEKVDSGIKTTKKFERWYKKKFAGKKSISQETIEITNALNDTFSEFNLEKAAEPVDLTEAEYTNAMNEYFKK